MVFFKFKNSRKTQSWFDTQLNFNGFDWHFLPVTFLFGWQSEWLDNQRKKRKVDKPCIKELLIWPCPEKSTKFLIGSGIEFAVSWLAIQSLTLKAKWKFMMGTYGFLQLSDKKSWTGTVCEDFTVLAVIMCRGHLSLVEWAKWTWMYNYHSSKRSWTFKHHILNIFCVISWILNVHYTKQRVIQTKIENDHTKKTKIACPMLQ